MKRMKFNLFILLCIILEMAHSQPANPAGMDTSCGITWLPPVKLSPEGTTGYIPRMAVQGDTVHLIFEWSNTYRLPYLRSTNAGLDWEPIRELIIDTVQFPYWNVSNLKIASNDKQLYIFFIGGSDGSGQTPIFMLSSSDRGDSFTEPRAINQGNPFPRNVAILGDTIVISVLVYGIMWDRTIFSTNGGLTWTIGAGSIYSASTMVALTRNWTHEFHHIYIDGYNFEMVHKRSSDFGMTWQDSSIISTLDNWSSMEPSPLGTLDNDLFIIWRDAKYGCIGFGCSGIIRQSTDEGTSWLPEVVVTDTPWTLNHSLAIRKPIIAAAWFTDDPNINVETNISYDYGKTWCQVFKVTPNRSYTIGPHIVLTTRSVVIAWTSRDSIGAPFQIWCRVGLLPTSVVKDEGDFLQTDYKVLPAYPNPFNSSATIKYSLPKGSDVKLSIYNILGERVATLVNGFQTAGWQEAVWDAGNSPSGVYVYRFTAGKFSSAGKLLLIK